MKIGYPCLNLSLGCTSSGTFRLRSFSPRLLGEKAASNLECLRRILTYNIAHDILFFRITSDLVPFASHPVCRCDWRRRFRVEFTGIGDFIRRHGIRISMHPDQFTLINAHDRGIVARSVRELRYHADVLDALGLDRAAKIQIHVGGLYGDRKKSIERFITRYRLLDERLRQRLVIENDDRNFTVADCLRIHHETGVPVLLDVFHHSLNNRGEPIEDVFPRVFSTWGRNDGLPMLDFSAQARGARRGTHIRSLPPSRFAQFLSCSKPYDFDVMLEIKDKERSARAAVRLAKDDARFVTATLASTPSWVLL